MPSLVEAADIQRVVENYLVESNLTVGWSLPRPDAGKADDCVAFERAAACSRRRRFLITPLH